MRRFEAYLMALSLFLGVSGVCAEQTTFDVVMSAKECKEDKDFQTISCEYRVGNDLYFVIAGIGLPDTAITFFKSSFQGDFYATYGLMHGCVIVKRGNKDGNLLTGGFAFVSPRNGKVYRTWQDCKEGM